MTNQFMNAFPTRRFFHPKRTDDLVERAKPWIDKWVTVDGWHENYAMKDTYPNDERVGWVVEISADLPESELLLCEPEV